MLGSPLETVGNNSVPSLFPLSYLALCPLANLPSPPMSVVLSTMPMCRASTLGTLFWQSTRSRSTPSLVRVGSILHLPRASHYSIQMFGVTRFCIFFDTFLASVGCSVQAAASSFNTGCSGCVAASRTIAPHNYSCTMVTKAWPFHRGVACLLFDCARGIGRTQ
jgi:hypothetical protein